MRFLLLVSTVMALSGWQMVHAQTSGCGQGPETPLSNINGSGENTDLRETQGGGGPSFGFSTCDRDNDRRFGPQFNKENAVDDLTDPDPKTDPVWGIEKAEPEINLALPQQTKLECLDASMMTVIEKENAMAEGKMLCPQS